MRREFDSYRLSRLAEADLADIYEYTMTRWSVEQAHRYITALRTALADLVDGRKVGRRRPDLPEDYLFYPVGSHLILYRAESRIFVVRVLHKSMDVPRHLEP